MSACQTKPQAEIDVEEYVETDAIPELVELPIKKVLEGNVNSDVVITADKDDIVAFDNDESGEKGSFAIMDVKGDELLLLNNNGPAIFDLSSRSFTLMPENTGKNSKKLKALSFSLMSAGKDSIFEVEPSWKSGTEIYGYDRSLKSGNRIYLDGCIGSIVRETDSTYLATNGVSASNNEGIFYLYRLNDRLQKTDSIVLPEVYDPLQTFNKILGIKNDGENNMVMIKDTLYCISKNLEVFPYVAFDAEFPDTIKVRDYQNVLQYREAIGNYVLMFDVRKAGNLLFGVETYKDDVYYSIFDVDDSGLLYNFKRDKNEIGIPFRIGDVEFRSWPWDKVWNNNILFTVVGKDMDRIFGKKGSSNGILVIPIEKFTSYFKK